MSCLEFSILIEAVKQTLVYRTVLVYRTCTVRTVLCIMTSREQLPVCVKSQNQHGAKPRGSNVMGQTTRLPSLLPLQMDAVSLARQASVRFYIIRQIKLPPSASRRPPRPVIASALVSAASSARPPPGLWGPLGVGRRPAPWRTIKPAADGGE